MSSAVTGRRLTEAEFLANPHAAKYRAAIEEHHEAFTRLLALLNDPRNEQRLTDAERQRRPALAGIVDFVERDRAIVLVLDSGPDSLRFRQAVGVAVKLKMAKLGWKTTGRKGTVSNATHFTKAERYEPPTDEEAERLRIERALAALDRVANMGTEEERFETGEWLMQALAETRAAEGRVF